MSDEQLSSSLENQMENQAQIHDQSQDVDAESARLLNQQEIDNLLGINIETDLKHGLEILLDSKTITYERLPMLEVIFDRLVRLLSTTLRNLTLENIEISLEEMTSVRFGESLDNISLPSIIGVIKAQEWDNSLLMIADTALTYSIVDVFLGGRRGEVSRFEGRSFTTIEQNLMERMFKVILEDIEKSFAPISDVTFHLERLETNPRFATVVRPMNATIVVRMKIKMESKGGYLDFVIPYGTLEPIRDQLLQMFMGEKFGQDSIWESHLGKELWDTEIQLDAVIDSITTSLDEVISWTPGSQIMFKTRPNADIMLKCGDANIFCGRIGQRNNNIAIQVNKNKIKRKELS